MSRPVCGVHIDLSFIEEFPKKYICPQLQACLSQGITATH